MNLLPMSMWSDLDWYCNFGLSYGDIQDRCLNLIPEEHGYVPPSYFRARTCLIGLVNRFLKTDTGNKVQWHRFIESMGVCHESLMLEVFMDILALRRMGYSTNFLDGKFHFMEAIWKDWLSFYEAVCDCEANKTTLRVFPFTVDMEVVKDHYLKEKFMGRTGLGEELELRDSPFTFFGFFSIPFLRRPKALRISLVDKAIDLVTKEIATIQDLRIAGEDINYLYMKVRIDNEAKIWGVYIARQERLVELEAYRKTL